MPEDPGTCHLLNRMDSALSAWASFATDPKDGDERRRGLALYRRMRTEQFHGDDRPEAAGWTPPSTNQEPVHA